jgi:hypothetical protein
MGPRYVVDLLQVVPPSDLSFLFKLWALFPGAMSMASTGPFDSTVCTLGGLPPGSQGLGTPQVVEDRTALCGDSRGAKSGSTSPSFRLPCGGALCSCSPSCSNTSTSLSPFRDDASGLHLPSGGCVSNPRLRWVFVGRLWLGLALPWQCLGWRLVRALALSQQRFNFTSTPRIISCPGYYRFGLGGGGFLNLASGFEAGGFLCQGCQWYSSHSRHERVMNHRYVFQC